MRHLHARIGSGLALVSATLVLLATLLLLTPRPAGAHAGNNDPSLIHVCVGGYGGVRIVGVTGTCTATETPQHWASLDQVTALQTALNNEIASAQAAETALTSALNNEVAARQAQVNVEIARAQAAETALQITLATLQAQFAPLLAHLSVVPGALNGLNGPHILIDGANLHVRNGANSTSALGSGLGNLMIGYTEFPDRGILEAARQGSHNLIIGAKHTYANYGGLVAGEGNDLAGAAASVTGGTGNKATGHFASVSGGLQNMASGDFRPAAGPRA